MFTQEEHTLEVYRLIIGSDEAEAEAEGSISEYLLERKEVSPNTCLSVEFFMPIN